MSLDIRTIVVLLGVTAVLMALALWLGTAASRSRRGGIGTWIGGLGFIALGWLLIAAHGYVHVLASVALANALLLTGLSLHVAAFLEFERQHVPRWVFYAPGAALFAMLAFLADDFRAVTTLLSLAYAVTFAVSAALALTRRGVERAVRYAMAGAYIVGAGALLARLALAWAAPNEMSEIFLEGLVQTLSFTALFSMLIVISLGFLVMQRDRAEGAARRLAMFDGLTRLFNRQAFLELAARELARAGRTHARYAVLMMDIDHFKRVNDTYGHLAGDRVLAAFAAVARRFMRRADIVGRYGGEEFCALLPGMTLEQGVAAAERIRMAVASKPLDRQRSHVTVSIGVTAGQGACDMEQLIARSDEALYQAKAGGRNCVVGLPLATGTSASGGHASISSAGLR